MAGLSPSAKDPHSQRLATDIRSHEPALPGYQGVAFRDETLNPIM